MKNQVTQSLLLHVVVYSALTAQTTAIDVELHNVTLAEVLKKLETKVALISCSTIKMLSLIM